MAKMIQRTRRLSKLRTRMTLSYMVVSVMGVLSLETLLAIIAFIVLVFSPALDTIELTNADRIAHAYAQMASVQAGMRTSLDSHATFVPDQPSTLTLPGIDSSNTDISNSVPYIASPSPDSHPFASDAFALLISPDSSVLASSYPSQYPAHIQAARVLPAQYPIIASALKGKEGKMMKSTTAGRIGSVAVPVFNQNRQIIGAVYVQLPAEISSIDFFLNFLKGFLITGFVTLLITAPTGALFGLISTRGLVRRVQRLVDATTQFANGHYEQRVQVMSEDEAGQLERQFNQMAEQLVESIEQQQTLTEQNTRFAERARISRDLHDSVKQQMFALTMQVSTALTLLDTQPEVVRSHLTEAETLAHQVQQELTTLIQSLRPSALIEKGLAIVLRDYVTTWSRQQQISVQQHIDVCTLPPLLEEALLRIAQEALSNIARHSHASSVILHLSYEQEQVELSIEDNGCGFDVASNKQLTGNGIGLQSMNERVEALQGAFCIESQPGQGTKIRANIAVCDREVDDERLR